MSQSQQKTFNSGNSGLSAAEKKRREDRQQWLIMGGGLGGVFILIGGFLLYAIFAQPDSRKTSSPLVVVVKAKKSSSGAVTAVARKNTVTRSASSQGGGGGNFGPDSKPKPEYYGTALDKRSIEEASAYKNRNNPGRATTSYVVITRSPYAAKIENRREKDARLKRIAAIRNGGSRERLSSQEKDLRQREAQTALARKPPKNIGEKEMAEIVKKSLLGQ